MSSCPHGLERDDGTAATPSGLEATITPGTEYGTERPCEIGRITYTVGVHPYVALAFRYTDEPNDWRLTWIGWDGTSDAVQLPGGIGPSTEMLAALAIAPVDTAEEVTA